MELWGVLIINTVMASIALGTANANDQLVRELALLKRARYNKGLMFLLSLLALTNVALWTRYAFVVGDWRFAAISGVPFLLGWIGRVTRRATSKQERV